jgi:hypothetical protein
MSNRQPRQPSRPAMGPQGQAVVDRLLAHVTELEFCEHDAEGFAMWIATRPGRLLCGFCYQAAQLLAGGRGRMSVPDVADLIVIAARVLEIGTGETLELTDLSAAEGALAVHPAGRDELVEDPRTAAGTLSQYANLQTLKTLLQASVAAPGTTIHRADPDGADLATTVTITITSAAPTVGFFRRADVRGGNRARRGQRAAVLDLERQRHHALARRIRGAQCQLQLGRSAGRHPCHQRLRMERAEDRHCGTGAVTCPAGSGRPAYLSPRVLRLAHSSDTAIAAPRSTPAVTARRRTVHRWMRMGALAGASVRKAPTRSRPSLRISARS